VSVWCRVLTGAMGGGGRGRRVHFYRERMLQEQRSLLEAERARSHTLLKNILPDSIIMELQRGDDLLASRFEEVPLFSAKHHRHHFPMLALPRSQASMTG
jgi:hypothetical protein